MNRGPRVLLVTPDYPPARGGIQYLLHGLVRHATRVRFRVLALGAVAGITDESGVLTRRIASRGPRHGSVALLSAAALSEIHAWRPHVVLSGHIVAAPVVQVTGVPFVQYLYAAEVAHRRRLASFAVRHAWGAIVLGEHGRALALGVGACRERVHVIAPGIDLPGPPATTPGDRTAKVVSVARLEDRYKGFEVLVRALPLIRSRVPDATLTLVGDGDLRGSLEALARANGCGRALRCVGAVTDEQRDVLLASAAVFAMPSRVPVGSGGEGFGIVYLEAGAHGTPVVAGDCGGARDAVLHGQTGVLVTPENHVEVAEAVSDLLLDRALATRLGAGGRAWAEGFAWPTVVRRVEDVLIGAAESRDR